MRILPALFCLLSLLIFPSRALAAIELTANIKESDGETITLEVNLTGTSNSYYLQGLFTKPGKTDYFGYTQNHQADWFLVDATPSKEFITSNFFKTEPNNDSWSDELKVKNDPENKNYKDSGEYELKIRRYTGNSTSHTGGEVVVITSLDYVLPTPSPSPASTQESTPTPTPTPTPESTLASTSYKITTTPTPRGEIAGASDSAEINLATFTIDLSPSPEPEEEKQKKSKTPLALAGAGLTFTAAGGAYFYQQKKKKPKINIPDE